MISKLIESIKKKVTYWKRLYDRPALADKHSRTTEYFEMFDEFSGRTFDGMLIRYYTDSGAIWLPRIQLFCKQWCEIDKSAGDPLVKQVLYHINFLPFQRLRVAESTIYYATGDRSRRIAKAYNRDGTVNMEAQWDHNNNGKAVWFYPDGSIEQISGLFGREKHGMTFVFQKKTQKVISYVFYNKGRDITEEVSEEIGGDWSEENIAYLKIKYI